MVEVPLLLEAMGGEFGVPGDGEPLVPGEVVTDGDPGLFGVPAKMSFCAPCAQRDQ